MALPRRWLRAVLWVPALEETEREPAAVTHARDRSEAGAHRLELGALGFGIGSALTLAGWFLGLAIDGWLTARIGWWAEGSKWLGDVALMPFVFAGVGMIIALTGLYRVVSALIPSLMGRSRLAGAARIILIALLGTGLLFAAFVAGVWRP